MVRVLPGTTIELSEERWDEGPALLDSLFLGGGLSLGLSGGNDLSVQVIGALPDDFYHKNFPPFVSGGISARPLVLTA